MWLTHFESTTTEAVFRLAGADLPATDATGAAEPADPREPRDAGSAAIDPWPWVELLLIAAGVAFLLLSRRERT